ncbi:MAG: type II CRISPR RNA-guided endonuclease Cas9 [Stenotrophobium sp.]
MRYRLGLDLGTNSIGWCILQLSDAQPPVPNKLIRLGARIFSDGRNPKDKASLAVARREARQMRRRRDRFLKRRDRFIQALIKHGLLPQDLTQRKTLVTLDPYALRKRGLYEVLPLHHIGRALFHLNQRRGFKSNRRVDKSAADDAGKIKTATRGVRESIATSGAKTAGEWLAWRHDPKLRDANSQEKRQPVRARLRGKGAKAFYELYLDRELIADEFDALWVAQSSMHTRNELPEEARLELREILLHQRRLKPVEPGHCTLDPSDKRAPLALPSTQRFRIYQELNNLRVLQDNFGDAALTLAQRDILASELETSSKRSFDQIRRKLKLGAMRFNLESEKRKELKGHLTSVILSKQQHIGDAWHQMTPQRQDDIVEKLLTEENETKLIDWLQNELRLPTENAIATANCSLPDGYGMIGRKALSRILPCLQAKVIVYSDAVREAGYQSHSQFYDGEIHPALPYYGEILERYTDHGSGNPKDGDEKQFGRIANPTVHIGLNQIRKVINTIIERYGHPYEIIVEIARDLKLSKDKREEIQKEQAKRQDQNDRYRADLARLGFPDNGENRLRMRLHHEQAHGALACLCPYTGEPISETMLFSGEVEIDHILPFSRTLDDSQANKVLCLRRVNRDKSNSTPHEAFSHSPPGYNWEEIRARAEALAKNKSWRFAPDAMERFLKDRDFLARHLTDTQYLSRVAKEYLSAICPPNAIWNTPGRLTSMLRGTLGLNRVLSVDDHKNRNDHRHHAIDAAVIAVSDRRLLQLMATASAHAREQQLTRLLRDMPQPWPTFRDEIKAAKDRIIVSHRPDHGWQGALLKETAYGLLPDGMATHRIALDQFKSAKDLEWIRDKQLCTKLTKLTEGLSGKEFIDKLLRYGEESGLRRIRIVEPLKTIGIEGRLGKPSHGEAYKGYMSGGNYCIEIFRNANSKWEGSVISTHRAHAIAKSNSARLRDTQKTQDDQLLIMRLCINDMVAMEEVKDQRRLYRVVKIGANGQIFFAEHFEANVDTRNRDPADTFKYISKTASSLFAARARRVFIDPLGFVLDPGFRS